MGLVAASIISSHCLDYQLRPSITSHLNKGVMRLAVWPATAGRVQPFLAHSVIRLVAANASFAPLWLEQLGDEWREASPKHTWPVLDDADGRWAIRAAIDAVVADAYGLSIEQYRQVLSLFSHRHDPKAPELCLAAFDELTHIGLDAFCKKHDPYWDIPLVTTRPKPVIDLPTGKVQEDTSDFQLTAPEAKSKRGRGRKGAG
jgi:hypothetical protein